MDRVEELQLGDISASTDASPTLPGTSQGAKKVVGMTNEASKTFSSILRIAGRADTNCVVWILHGRRRCALAVSRILFVLSCKRCVCGMIFVFCAQKLPKNATKQHTAASEAIAAVRRLKVDRDTLKDRLLELQPVIAAGKQHSEAKALMESISDAVSTMETLMGGPNPSHSDGVTSSDTEKEPIHI